MVHVILFSAIGLAFLTRKSGKWAQAIPFVVLFIFSALRYMYGNDYGNYYRNFYLIDIGGEVYHDAFFVWFNQVFPNFFAMIAFISFCFIAVVYWMMRKNLPSNYICMGLFIFIISPYIFLINLSALRQCLAMLFFIIGVHFSIKKNYIVYFLCVLVAMQFHPSAVILLPFCFLANEMKFGKKMFIAFCIGMIVCLTMDGFTSLIQRAASQFDDSNYLHYASNDLTNTIRATLLSAVSMIYVLINLPEVEGKTLAYSKLYLVATSLSVLAFRMSALTRIQMYFDIFAVIALPLLFKHNYEKGRVEIDRAHMGKTILEISKRYVLPALIIIIYLLRYYSFFTNPMWESFATYQTIFSAELT